MHIQCYRNVDWEQSNDVISLSSNSVGLSQSTPISYLGFAMLSGSPINMANTLMVLVIGGVVSEID